MIVIALLATDNLSETPKAVALLAKSLAIKRTCPLTGASSFYDAIARVLSRPKLCERVIAIGVERAAGKGSIRFKDGDVVIESIFTTNKPPKTQPALTVFASIGSSTLKSIANDLMAMFNEDQRDQS